MLRRSFIIGLLMYLFMASFFTLDVNAKEQTLIQEEASWVNIGEVRITSYCPACNDPAFSYQSSSGKTLREGYVACNWLENGTKVRIDGKEYVVMDTCGTDAIDIFHDTGYECYCSTNKKSLVQIKRKENTNAVCSR